ncbi:hypothetical protein AKJ16_DCAP08945 [Drosera capensis]
MSKQNPKSGKPWAPAVLCSAPVQQSAAAGSDSSLTIPFGFASILIDTPPPRETQDYMNNSFSRDMPMANLMTLCNHGGDADLLAFESDLYDANSSMTLVPSRLQEENENPLTSDDDATIPELLAVHLVY